MDEWEKFAQAIRGSSGINSGNIYQNYANAGVINASPAQFVGKQKAIQAGIEETQRKESQAIAEKQKDLERQRELDAKDPNKAMMKIREDGVGYDFFDGTGKQININDFSMLTGKRPDELLADSNNPRDQQFVADYNAMRNISNAWVNGDTETLAAYRQADPEKFNELVSKYKSPAEMVSAFTEFYQDYYGPGESQDRPRFSPGDPRSGENVYGPDRSITLMDPNNSKRALGAPTLQQTLAPNAAGEAPRDLNWFEKINPFSGMKDEKKRYEERLKQNPWMAYHNALYGR